MHCSVHVHLMARLHSNFILASDTSSNYTTPSSNQPFLRIHTNFKQIFLVHMYTYACSYIKYINYVYVM